MKYDLDDLIADYLLDRLDPTSRRQFEQRLAAEPELAARVVLERDLAAALHTASHENQLRANLSRIAEQYATPEDLDPNREAAAAGKTRLWWLLAAALLCIGLAFWNLRQREQPAGPTSAPEAPTVIPGMDLPKPDARPKPGISPPSAPIAAAFRPLPQLESYVGAQVRGGTFHFRVDEPRSGSTLPKRSGQTTFQFSGKIEGAVPEGTTFKVLIFNNYRPDFEAMRPLTSQALLPGAGGDFLFQKALPLPPGLYYYLLEEQPSGAWLFAGKFFVK